MEHDPFEREKMLTEQLDRYVVEVPDFPMRRSFMDKMADYWFSPAKNPFESIVASHRGLSVTLLAMPLVGLGFTYSLVLWLIPG